MTTSPNAQPQQTHQQTPPHQAEAWTLPSSGAALRLVDEDYKRAAAELGVETAAIHAVAQVEAAGRTGFDAQKRPKILFEIHHFRGFTHGRYDKTHPHISAPYKSKERTRSYKRDQWVVMHEAFALDPTAALKSASWGLFQVLGENYPQGGWKTVQSFVDSMFYSEGQHMRAFLGYCRANHLVKYLKAHNWTAFASGYNGASYKDNHYDRKMAQAYAMYAHKH